MKMSARNPRLHNLAIRILVFMFCSLQWLFAQNVRIPENIQGALLEKALKFNTRLSQETNISMLIIYSENSQVSAERQRRAVSSHWTVSMALDVTSVTDLSAYDLVYFMPGTEKQALSCKEYDVLSVSGTSLSVEQGLVSMAFGLQNDKPRIFVNISSLKAEGHSFSSEILRIMQVTK